MRHVVRSIQPCLNEVSAHSQHASRGVLKTESAPFGKVALITIASSSPCHRNCRHRMLNLLSKGQVFRSNLVLFQEEGSDVGGFLRAHRNVLPFEETRSLGHNHHTYMSVLAWMHGHSPPNSSSSMIYTRTIESNNQAQTDHALIRMHVRAIWKPRPERTIPKILKHAHGFLNLENPCREDG